MPQIAEAVSGQAAVGVAACLEDIFIAKPDNRHGGFHQKDAQQLFYGVGLQLI
ncbi:MAG: hypothetical protein HFG58_13500 [Lachnospiraceae bacterium]|nr:hypothetical protein [Lachnospiraceae bacterium]